MNLSSSKLELAEKCIGSFTLPQSAESNPYAEAGKRRHAVDEAAINRGDVPDVLEETWPGYEWRSEVTFVYDVATGEGRELGQGLERDYSRATWAEIPGTADAVGVKREDGRIVALVIADKKGYEEVTAAKRNLQLRSLALAACRTYGLESADVGITSEHRAPDVATLGVYELQETACIVREIVIAIKKAQEDAEAGRPVPFAVGRQCRWCDSFWNCDRQKELRALVRSPRFQVENKIALATDEEAAEAYEFMKRLGTLYNRVKQTVIGRAAVRPIPLGNGRIFGERKKLGNREINGDIAYQVMRELYGQEAADAATAREASQASIKRALEKLSLSESADAAKDKIVDAIAAKGGVTRKEKREVDEHDDPRLLKEAG